MNQEAYGHALKIFRVAKGLTLEDLSAQAKLTTAQISLIENGIRTPSLEAQQRLCSILNLNIHTLYYFVKRIEFADGFIHAIPALDAEIVQVLSESYRHD